MLQMLLVCLACSAICASMYVLLEKRFWPSSNLLKAQFHSKTANTQEIGVRV